ncbi:hypothetical protein EVAR_83035_1 [Eumeta japonica]|uniref:Uncharacterized protein n=1 Tax=Eumeta variegata TaxID=151549 RepID=A0A4C1VMZ7_EUMVA|nr:hypothetical protein EVAR_83035_1 [Eumeta japonica]
MPPERAVVLSFLASQTQHGELKPVWVFTVRIPHFLETWVVLQQARPREVTRNFRNHLCVKFTEASPRNLRELSDAYYARSWTRGIFYIYV